MIEKYNYLSYYLKINPYLLHLDDYRTKTKNFINSIGEIFNTSNKKVTYLQNSGMMLRIEEQENKIVINVPFLLCFNDINDLMNKVKLLFINILDNYHQTYYELINTNNWCVLSNNRIDNAKVIKINNDVSLFAAEEKENSNLNFYVTLTTEEGKIDKYEYHKKEGKYYYLMTINGKIKEVIQTKNLLDYTKRIFSKTNKFFTKLNDNYIKSFKCDLVDYYQITKEDYYFYKTIK